MKKLFSMLFVLAMMSSNAGELRDEDLAGTADSRQKSEAETLAVCVDLYDGDERQVGDCGLDFHYRFKYTCSVNDTIGTVLEKIENEKVVKERAGSFGRITFLRALKDYGYGDTHTYYVNSFSLNQLKPEDGNEIDLSVHMCIR